MSNILKFIQQNTTFDPDTLLLLGDVYDRACDQSCTGRLDTACEGMASRIVDAALNGERDRDRLWQIAVPRT
jgi:hypothetical protein